MEANLPSHFCTQMIQSIVQPIVNYVHEWATGNCKAVEVHPHLLHSLQSALALECVPVDYDALGIANNKLYIICLYYNLIVQVCFSSDVITPGIL